MGLSVCLRGEGGGQPPPLFASSSGAGRAPPVPALPSAPPSPPRFFQPLPSAVGSPAPPPHQPGQRAPQSLHGAEGPPPGSRAPPPTTHLPHPTAQRALSPGLLGGGGEGAAASRPRPPRPGRAALPVSSHHPPLPLLLVPVPPPPPGDPWGRGEAGVPPGRNQRGSPTRGPPGTEPPPLLPGAGGGGGGWDPAHLGGRGGGSELRLRRCGPPGLPPFCPPL